MGGLTASGILFRRTTTRFFFHGSVIRRLGLVDLARIDLRLYLVVLLQAALTGILQQLLVRKVAVLNKHRSRA